MKTDLTREDVFFIRQLMNDRIENRFRMAEKASAEMNLKTLKGCVDEIERLENLKERMGSGND